jgi:hypothetical protein
MHGVRAAIPKTSPLANGEFATIRERLIKIGARAIEHIARIRVQLPTSNHRRYHESIDNLTPADVYFGCGQTILLKRERIKRKTIQTRRLIHRRQAA